MDGHTEELEKEHGVDLAEFSLYFSSKSPQPMVAVEGKTHIVRYVNDAFEQLAHVKRSRLIGRPFDDAVPEGKNNKCLELLDRAFHMANPEVLLEQEHSNFDPPVHWSYFVWPIMGRSGEYPVGVMIQITDATEVTEAKRMAAEAMQASMNLSRELELKNKELESIIGVVSHDLRAPLVNVKGFSSEIKKDRDTITKLLSQVYLPQEINVEIRTILEKYIPQSLNFIDSSADAMNTLVKSLVDVAKIGMAVLKPENLDMNEIVPSIISTLEIKFRHTGAQVCFDNLPSCRADKVQITRIFTNLIDNAVKYLDPDRPGQICIGGQIDKDRVIYCVSDNGVGIPAEDQGKMFELFTRLASKAHAGGEGMGLAMVKRLIDRNNGKIWVISEPGKGSNFFVSLPAPHKA